MGLYLGDHGGRLAVDALAQAGDGECDVRDGLDHVEGVEGEVALGRGRGRGRVRGRVRVSHEDQHARHPLLALGPRLWHRLGRPPG